MTEDLLMQELEQERQRFVGACLIDDGVAAVAAHRASLELMAEHKENMREDLMALKKRIRLRKEGR